MPRIDLFDQPPGNDEHIPGSIGRKSEQPRIEAARQWFQQNLKALQGRMNAAGHADSTAPTLRLDLFLPYLLVRSAPGDMGRRQANYDDYHSPDIWVAAGDPPTAPLIPDEPLTELVVPLSYTVYAHVWNLGRAPIVGARVEFYFSEIYPADLPPSALFQGAASVDLAPRTSSGCHTLVKCPTGLDPLKFYTVREVELTVRVSCVGDPIGTHPWNPSFNRHVARRVVGISK